MLLEVEKNQRSNPQLILLSDISNLIVRAPSYSCVIEDVIERLLEHYQAWAGCVLILDRDRRFRPLTWHGDDSIKGCWPKICQELLAISSLEKSQIIKGRKVTEAFSMPSNPNCWLIFTPIWIEGKIVGVLALAGGETSVLDNSDLTVMEIIAHQISSVLERELFKEEIKNFKNYSNAVLESLSEGIVLIFGSKIIYSNKTGRNLLKLGYDYHNQSYEELTQLMIAQSKEPLKTQIYLETGKTIKTPYYTFEIETKEKVALRITRFIIATEKNSNPLANIGLLVSNVSKQKQVNSLKDNLIAVVSHELRTPLTSIKGYTSSLLRKDVVWSEEVKKSFLEDIYDECSRLNQLIEKLLDLSKIESGVLKLDKELIDLSGFLVSIKDLLINRYHQRLTIDLAISEGLDAISLDKYKMTQVFLNLVDNAIKYGHEMVHVNINVYKRENRMVFEVADNGPGIDPQSMGRIFNKFYQSNRARGATGAGLGLAICKGFVEAHGGNIWMESLQHQGSCFYFTLPLSDY